MEAIRRFIQELLDLIQELYMPSNDNITEVNLDVENPTKSEILYDIAYSCIGIDMAPTQDAFGCAEAVYYVLKKAGVQGLPKQPIVSSLELDKWLQAHFERIDEPEVGCVISSPTGAGNGRIRGHVGIVGKHSIMSNNSNTHEWDYHWKLDKWKNYYGDYGGLPIRYYRWI